MPTAPPSTGEKPPDQRQNVRLTNTHPIQQTSFQNSIPVATDLQIGATITVHQNQLGASEISQVNSESNLELSNRRDYSPSCCAPLIQNSDNSTVGIAGNDHLNFSEVAEMAGTGVPTGQIENSRYQNAPSAEENRIEAPIPHGYQPIPSILQASSAANLPPSSVRQNAPLSSEPIQMQQPITIASTSSQEQACKFSNKYDVGIDQLDHGEISAFGQLAGYDVSPAHPLTNHQLEMLPSANLTNPIPPNTQLHNQNTTDIQPKIPTLQVLDKTANTNQSQGDHFTGMPTPNSHDTIQNETQLHKPQTLTPGNISDPSAMSAPLQTNGANHVPLTVHHANKSTNTATPKISSNFDRPNIPKKNQKNQSNLPEKTPQPPQITPANIAIPQPSINPNKTKPPANSPPSPPTVTHSYVTRLRARHEAEIKPISFTPPKITTKQGQPAVIFKREDYMVRFTDRCKFTVVDLDNEYDHSIVWGKQHMYIQGQMMKLEAWTPAFKPNEDSPIVPIWVIIPEMPWHLYYMEILTPLLSPIGKALYLDLDSFQKTRGSVAKVKIQIDLTKARPHNVWLGYDKEQDENGDGEWLEVQYDNVPAYCTHCIHLEDSIPIPQSYDVINVDEVEGGKGECQGKPVEKQVGVPKGVGVPHVLHECAKAQLTDHRNDQPTPATTFSNANEQRSPVESDEYTEVVDKDLEDHMRTLLKGKAHAQADFHIQPQKPRNKLRVTEDDVSTHKFTEIANPSLSQPLLSHKDQSYDFEQPTSESTPTPVNNLKIAPHLHPLEMALEQCPLNKYSSQEDEYMLIQSEDEMGEQQEEDIDQTDEEAETEQHCDLLIAAVNGVDNQTNSASARKSLQMRISPRTSGAIERLRILKQIHNLSFIAVLEPILHHADHSHINQFQLQFSMDHSASNINNKIWIFWDKDFTAKVLDHDEQQLSLEMRHVVDDNTFYVTVIYAKCKPAMRRPLWDILRHKSTNYTHPWCVIGDFNVIASVEEKIGGLSYQMSKSLDFLSMMEECGLVDLGYYGPKYT
ncbi:hypothetical protein A4A49_02536 [Nicotiana attenuata]|uniref:Uncharacterized protein n=1 Tax=Nicotiana attenuata TaxID=49451 RepID=A0A314L1E0_NICAT|nr:hypothetical protein A4A49_02536 [Nicotiana attenuata]